MSIMQFITWISSIREPKQWMIIGGQKTKHKVVLILARKMYRKRTIQLKRIKRNERAWSKYQRACMHSVKCFCAQSAMYTDTMQYARVIKFCYNQCIMPRCSTKAFKHIFYWYSYKLSLYNVHNYCDFRHNTSLNQSQKAKRFENSWTILSCREYLNLIKRANW
jgi:hypothetical protein